MESSHKEYHGTECMPAVKEELHDFPVDFPYADKSPGNCDKSFHLKKGTFIPGLLPSTSVVQSLDITNGANKKKEGVPTKVPYPDARIPESFSSVRYDFSSSERVGTDVGIPLQELSAIEQISIKTDEVFIDRAEEQSISDNLSDAASESDIVGNGVRNGALLDKTSNGRNTSPEGLKETPAEGLTRPVEDAPIFSCIGGKKRGRRKKAKSHHLEEASPADNVSKKDKTNESRSRGSEKDEQEPLPSENDINGLNFQRMPRKKCERKSKRVLKNRSLGSLPKACRIQRPAEKKLLQGLGVKRFYCTLCKAKFNQSHQLKRHVLEMHEGQPCSNKDSSYPPSVSVTFTCPLCHVSYGWKYCLKRHFAGKHSDAKNIPCPECKYKAETLTGYLKHIEKHKPKQTGALPIHNDPSHISSVKCHECFKLFQSSDALRLHVIDHKITLCLSQVESFLSSEKISISSSASSVEKASNTSSTNALHLAPSNISFDEVHNQNLLSCLPQELKLEVEDSFNHIFKVASQLDFLAHSVRTLTIGCTSLNSQKPLLAINHMTNLSAELTKLSTALGHVLHSHVQKKDEKDVKGRANDPVEEESDNDSNEPNGIEKKNSVILDTCEESDQQEVDGLFEQNVELGQENEEEISSPHYEDIFQDNNEQTIVEESEEATFRDRIKGCLQENDEETIDMDNESEILKKNGKSSQENDERALDNKRQGKNLQDNVKALSQENYMRLVLEEVEDFVVVEDNAMDKCLEKKVYETASETSLGQASTLQLQPPRKKSKASERQPVTFKSSKIQTRRNERQALKLKASKSEAKTSKHEDASARTNSKGKSHMINVPETVASNDEFQPESNPARTEGGSVTFEKLVEDHKTSKTAHGYKCRECGKISSQFAYLKRHLMMHLDLRPFKCTVCNKSFRSKSHVKQHAVMHSDERPFKCDMCDFDAKTAKTLHNHSLTHGDRCYPCEKCSYKGRTAYELSKHEEKHKPCSLCGYVASDIADYRMHKRSHVIYSCTECNFSCHANWQLLQHSKKHTAPKVLEKLYCELCGYSCTNKRRLDYHMARHDNKTPLSCSICDYKCSSRASFDAHKLMHAGLKPYLCSTCGMSFRTSTQMKTHMLVHKEEKKHVCRICGRPFRARHNLRVHEMIHTGERKHRCQLCHFACRRNRELAVHMMKHKVLDGKEEDSKTID